MHLKCLKKGFCLNNQMGWLQFMQTIHSSKGEVYFSFIFQELEASGGWQFYRIRWVIKDLKYPSMSAPLMPCIFGKLAAA